jgi:hypothetical protein
VFHGVLLKGEPFRSAGGIAAKREAAGYDRMLGGTGRDAAWRGVAWRGVAWRAKTLCLLKRCCDFDE